MRQALLIRHGESEANAGGATADPATIPLTARGVAQARLVARALPQQPSLIVSSSYLRAIDTAIPARERFPSSPYAQWPVHEFTYLACEPGVPSTVAERLPRVEAFWTRADPLYVDGPGVESFSGLLDRVDRLFSMLRGAPGDLVVVYSHGLFMRVVLWTVAIGALPRTADAMRRFRRFAEAIPLPNGCVLRLHGIGTDAWSASGLDVSHLPIDLTTQG